MCRWKTMISASSNHQNPVDPGKSPSELEIPAVPDPQALEDPWDSRRNARNERPVLVVVQFFSGVGAWISGECCLYWNCYITPGQKFDELIPKNSPFQKCHLFLGFPIILGPSLAFFVDLGGCNLSKVVSKGPFVPSLKWCNSAGSWWYALVTQMQVMIHPHSFKATQTNLVYIYIYYHWLTNCKHLTFWVAGNPGPIPEWLPQWNQAH